jgi:A/G-specific adenine glycosylase
MQRWKGRVATFFRNLQLKRFQQLTYNAFPTMSCSQLTSNIAFDVPRFRRRLLGWYDTHKRDLPWRKNHDAYRVWLAEIMLQQTRVAAVIEYYNRFLKRFPTIESLAAARLPSVLAAWSGLGYYRRARALHQAAKHIVKNGAFPETSHELKMLPGIGRYTAAAIASIAFDEPVAVVDGNVERVLQRSFGKTLGREESWLVAGKLLSRRRPGDFNQAMMELGATLCLTKKPKCLVCPVAEFCATRGELERESSEIRKKREISYLLDLRDGAVFLVRRPSSSSLMPNMWELPELTTPNGDRQFAFTMKHSITVTDYTVRVARATASDLVGGRWFNESRVAFLPLTGLTRKILRVAEVI